jgi:hypothetical protein
MDTLRSPGEIFFRVRQETANAYQYLHPPEAEIDPAFQPRIRLPDPLRAAKAIQGTAFEQEISALAGQIRKHCFPIFGTTIDTGPEIPWRRDWLSGVETGLRYFRRIPYLDARRAGDHKVIWELNRHQHLVVLAQAFCLNGDAANLAEIRVQLESWFSSNPYNQGINWASALEVAFRALSWIWAYHMAGGKMVVEFRVKWLRELYRHGCYLERNLSFYFSPNTHLLGEALALHTLGLFFGGQGRAARWEQLGATVMRQEISRQVRADGSHVEQSSYYHLYATDMFLLHAILAKPDTDYMDKLARMVDYLHALLGPSRTLPLIGDDDGGRLFHPYGERGHFGRATIATASRVLERSDWRAEAEDVPPQALWWLGVDALARKPGEGKRGSRLFSDAGTAVLTAGTNQVIVDVGPFGPWSAGHSHADTLSVVVRSGDRDILIDPGTCTYVGEQKWRDWFRGTEAHNTVRIDRRGQAVAAGPFRWAEHPQVSILNWKTNATRDLVEGECRYRGFTHRRSVEFQKPDVVVIVDEIEGPAGEHEIEQLWHLGSADARACLELPDGAEMVESWRSAVFGEKHAAPVVRVARRCELPVRLEARIKL